MRILLALFFVFCISMPAQAEEMGAGYAEPSFKGLTQTLMALRSYERERNDLVDDYARVVYCDLYKEKYTNDFEWARIRSAIRKEIERSHENAQRHYEFWVPVFLERYNFEGQYFALTKETAFNQIGSMLFFEETIYKGPCNPEAKVNFFPGAYSIKLQAPLTLTEMHLKPKDAEMLIKKMDMMGNKERKVYVRFRIRMDGFVGYDMYGLVKKAVLYGMIEHMDFFLSIDHGYHIVNTDL